MPYRKEQEAWVVYVVGPPRPECGHRRVALIAVCRAEGEMSAEEVAAHLCLDNRYLIGPVPYNTTFPDTAVNEWPNSYRPCTSEPSDEDTGPISLLLRP